MYNCSLLTIPNTVEPLVVTPSCNWLHLLSEQFSKIHVPEVFQVKSLYMEPLVRYYFSSGCNHIQSKKFEIFFCFQPPVRGHMTDKKSINWITRCCNIMAFLVCTRDRNLSHKKSFMWLLRNKSWWWIFWNFLWMFPIEHCFEKYN